MTDIGNVDVAVEVDRATCERLAELAEERDSLTRDPPECPRCRRVLTRWKRGSGGKIERAECNGCGWCR